MTALYNGTCEHKDCMMVLASLKVWGAERGNLENGQGEEEELIDHGMGYFPANIDATSLCM